MKLKPILCGSDTVSTVAKEILDSICKSSNKKSYPYGDDNYTKICKEKIKKIFEKNDIEIFPLVTGTASNSLALSSLCNSFGGIVCHENSHINKDECGAPEFFTNGGKLITVNSQNGKLSLSNINNKIKEFKHNSAFKTKIQAISVTQLAENGITYSYNELREIGEICKKNKLYFHMDGARFANALVYLKKKPAEITWKLGLDCLSLGATKNGALAAEVIIFFNTKLAKNFSFMQKKTGHVLPRTKFVTAQLNSWFQDDLWINLAKQANQNAKKLRKKLENNKYLKFIYPTHGNEIFVETSKDFLNKIQSKKIFPKIWKTTKGNKICLRFVTSFDMEENDIQEISSRIKNIG